jgi:hypothetical protein
MAHSSGLRSGLREPRVPLGLFGADCPPNRVVRARPRVTVGIARPQVWRDPRRGPAGLEDADKHQPPRRCFIVRSLGIISRRVWTRRPRRGARPRALYACRHARQSHERNGCARRRCPGHHRRSEASALRSRTHGALPWTPRGRLDLQGGRSASPRERASCEPQRCRRYPPAHRHKRGRV